MLVYVCMVAMLAVAPSQCYYHSTPYASLPTITLVQENAYAMGNKMAQIPLVLVQQNQLRVLQDNDGFYPYHQYSYHGYQDLPAVRIELPRPLIINHVTTMIEFPSSFTVLHQGYRHPINVGAVLAPVYTLDSGAPQEIHVVYAVPTRPVTYYPSYQQLIPFRRPVQPSKPVKQPSRPDDLQGSVQGEDKNPVRQPVQVTVLDFPSTVSSPSTLFFQPPVDPDSDLGNREPPQAVVPAGIVQSTAPLPNLSLFVNSKESSILQTLRDEAAKNRLANTYSADYLDYQIIIN